LEKKGSLHIKDVYEASIPTRSGREDLYREERAFVMLVLFTEMRFDRRFLDEYTDLSASRTTLDSSKSEIFSVSIAERSAEGREDDISCVAVESVSLSRRYCNSES
jgi:hypothetical protein